MNIFNYKKQYTCELCHLFDLSSFYHILSDMPVVSFESFYTDLIMSVGSRLDLVRYELEEAGKEMNKYSFGDRIPELVMEKYLGAFTKYQELESLRKFYDDIIFINKIKMTEMALELSSVRITRYTWQYHANPYDASILELRTKEVSNWNSIQANLKTMEDQLERKIEETFY